MNKKNSEAGRPFPFRLGRSLAVLFCADGRAYDRGPSSSFCILLT